MEYVVMSLEEAKKVAKKDAIVLVAKQDLALDDCNKSFERKQFKDCFNVLENSKTIAQCQDSFLEQLNVFSEKQSDLCNIIPKGTKHIILYKKQKNNIFEKKFENS